MPENRNGETKSVNESDMQATDKRETIDAFRVAPELALHRFAENRNELKTPTREMPYFAADDFYQFRTPGVAYENGGKDGFLPDGIRSDGSTPRHMMPEDNSGIDRKK